MSIKVAIIGGGAAGFFAAASVKEHHPEAQVTLLEKSSKLLAKVKISGGGRCNVTHDCLKPYELVKSYPRGSKPLRKVFDQFAVNDTLAWFENRGVRIKREIDGRMFPVTDDSQTIINALMEDVKQKGVQILLKQSVEQIKVEETLSLKINGNWQEFSHVIIATGGSPKQTGFDWLASLGHEIVPPVPSLFTFNMPNEPIKELMGLSVPKAQVKVLGTKLVQDGPLLITHWGMSGPAILKTSAWGARILAEKNYDFTIQVNWLGEQTEATLRSFISDHIQAFGKRMVKNKNPFVLPERLWLYFVEKIGLSEEKPWSELSKKDKNRLINLLLNDQYEVKGKTTFKEEFVTCGGVSLSSVDMKTMQSKEVPNLYFAGEVLDIDGVTGGFNFQAAWSTGFVAGKLSN